LKEKENQNLELQKKVFALYDKMEKQQAQITASQDFNSSLGSAASSKCFGKSGSRKNLVTEGCEREVNGR
jgi:hypothetical protein